MCIRDSSWASLFYLGITAGRFVSGFLTMKMSDRNMIRLGQVLIALGILLGLLPAGNKGSIQRTNTTRPRARLAPGRVYF